MIARRGPALALAVTCLVAALTGCSGDDPKATPTATATPTPSRSAPSVPAPALPAAAAANTPDGAIAFFRYYVALYNYTYATNSAAAIEKVSVDTCVFCHGVIQNADLSAQQGVRTVGGDLVIDRTQVSKGDAKNGAIVIGVVTQQTSKSVDKTGKQIAARTAERMLQFTALQRWVDGHWEMKDVQLQGAE